MDALTREPAELETRTRSTSWVIVLLCLLVVAGIGAAIWLWPAGSANQQARNRTANQPVPILAAKAEQKDVPIYLSGLGTVQAFNTVTMKAMVDGPLIAVNFKEGQNAHKGDLLAQIDPRPYQAALDQAVAKKAQDEALLANAKLDYARYQKLVANNYTSAQQADTAKAQVAQYQAMTEQDQAQIDNARTNLGYTSITAPIDGRTGIRQIDPGNIVHAVDATGLVVITQLQPISVLFTLPQQYLGAVSAAMAQGQPKVLAYEQSASGSPSALLDTGTLAVLDNQVDPTTGTIKLKATFPNPDSRLWPGGFVGVRLQVDTARNAVVVPQAAVQRGPRGAYVFLLSADQTAKRQPVTVNHEEAGLAVIAQGLQPGESVVVDGASRLDNGTKVTIVQPAAPGAQPSVDQPSAPGTRRRTAGGTP
ncbi:MAG: efflux RND transporter periplasmic adaptor subunit [Acetobacteraceae bacterium]|nr:efflux RND transporter periplasmic adaptor subunit [Acetobacteraceae bacterium]